MDFSKAYLLKDSGELEEELLAEAITKRGIPIEWYSLKHIQRRVLDLSDDVFFAGTVKSVTGALAQLEKELPQLLCYPHCLRDYLQRKVWISSLRELKNYFTEGSGKAVFAKPYDDTKRFTGTKISSLMDISVLGDISDSTKIWCSELVNFMTEYRVYISNGEIINISHYDGDKNVSLDRSVVDNALNKMTSSEESVAGFAMDFGVNNTGDTILIEVNDGFGLGAYKIGADEYYELIASRWMQLVS